MRYLLADIIRRYIEMTPPHPGRGVLGKLAWKLHPEEFEHELPTGVRIRVRLSDPVEIGYWTGTYDTDGEVAVFRSLICQGMTVVDIGANEGIYTLHSGLAVGSFGKVYAFEPVPDTYQRLLKHIRLNNTSNVLAFPFALADTEGVATFHLGKNSGEGSLFRVDTPRTITVRTLTLDSFLAEQRIEHVDIVKVDVEGAEMHVLRGMHGLLSRPGKPILMLEFCPSHLHAAGFTPSQLFDAIVTYGYRGHVIRKGQLVPVESVIEPVRSWLGSQLLDNYVFKPIRP